MCDCLETPPTKANDEHPLPLTGGNTLTRGGAGGPAPLSLATLPMQSANNEPLSGNVALTLRVGRNTQQLAMQQRTQANKEEDALLPPQDTDNTTLRDSCQGSVWPWLLNSCCWLVVCTC
jgi:hypothetical protein